MGKRDVYAHLIDLEAAVERQKKRIAKLEARLDAVEAFCERAVNAYPDLRDEYEALEQKDVK